MAEAPFIELDRVTKRFGGVTALDQVSFEIRCGEVHALVGPLAIGEKQLVEIARTLEQESRIIILDEPNSALNEAESQRLFDIVRRLRERGITLVYVSHRLEEVFAIADRITVLRDGRYQGTYATVETTIPQIITAMIGRRLGNSFSSRATPATPGPVALEVRELRQGTRLGPI